MVRIKTVNLANFRRFNNLTLNLGDDPKKIIALIGENGCGKSSIFDGFETQMAKFGRKNQKNVPMEYYNKSQYIDDLPEDFNQHKDIKICFTEQDFSISKNTFCIRSAYRHTSTLNIIRTSEMHDILEDYHRPSSSSDVDSRLIDNYQRIISDYFKEVPKSETKSGKELFIEKFKPINDILHKILAIEISDPGNILEPGRGKLFFKKGKSSDFPFDNLSAGEKEVIDLVLDLIVKRTDYTNTIFCIDEPELHLNTKIQRNLLVEIEKLIPETCQLWIATHSIG